MKRSHVVPALALSMAYCAALGQAALSVENNKPDRPIAGLPFTADLSVRTTQHLANGITVTRQMTGRIFRSSAGLERSEATLVTTDSASKPPITLAWIVDRAQHTVACVHVQSKFATITHLPATSTVSVGFLALPSGLTPESFRAGKTETTDLGRRTYDGLEVVGKLVTRTTSTGQAGNDAPFVATTEQWVDPQLNLVVDEIQRDPVDGERVVELTGLHTEEPAPELFKIPDGFQVQDQPPAMPTVPLRPSAP